MTQNNEKFTEKVSPVQWPAWWVKCWLERCVRLNISTMEFLSSALNNITNATLAPRCHSILAEVKVEQWLAIFEEKITTSKFSAELWREHSWTLLWRRNASFDTIVQHRAIVNLWPPSFAFLCQKIFLWRNHLVFFNTQRHKIAFWNAGLAILSFH